MEASPHRLVAGGLTAALLVTLLFAFSYVGALHDPHPQRMPIAVIDPSSAAAVRSSGGLFVPRVYKTETAVQAALRRRDVLVALLPPRLLIASAGGYAATQTAAAAFTRVKPALRVVDVAPLPPGDPRGLTLFYLAVALIFGGYIAATLVTTLVGPRSRDGRSATIRVGSLAGYSILAGLLTAIVVGPLIGAVPGHVVQVGAIGALVVLAAAAATSALQSLLGPAGTLVAMVVLLLLGNPSAGLYPGSFLPGFWRTIGPWLPGGAALSALRGSVYFGGSAIAAPLLLLAVYVVVGATSTIALASRRGEPSPGVEIASAAPLRHGPVVGPASLTGATDGANGDSQQAPKPQGGQLWRRLTTT
jgi:hypothetical protein